MKGFGDAKVGKDKSPRLGDLVDVFEWPQDDYAAIRLIGPVFSYSNVWFDIITKSGKKVSIPKLCLDHDGATDDYISDHCPYRASGKGRSSKYYVVNAIIRSIQEEKRKWPKPEGKKSKHLGYECYLTKRGAKNTPVRVVVIGSSVAEKIQQMQKLNRVTNKKTGEKKTYEASDPRYGFDINILFDPSKEGARKYDVQKGDRTPLTDDELNYPLYRLDLLKPDTLERAKREIADLADKIIEKDAKKGGKKRSDDDDDDEKPSKGKKKPSIDDDDLTDLDEDDLIGDDEDDDRPSKKKKRRDDDDDDRPKKGAKSKKRSRDEDDEDEEDEDDLSDLDDEDDEDDDRPSKKKKRSSDDDDEDDDRPSKKRRRDEDDEDEDDESEDDEDEDDESDEDEDEDEEDDEDERPRKKSSSNKKKGGKPNKKMKNKKRRRD